MGRATVGTNREVQTALTEKPDIWIELEDDSEAQNPVVEGAEFAYQVRSSDAF
jgi:hypothetical protein